MKAHRIYVCHYSQRSDVQHLKCQQELEGRHKGGWSWTEQRVVAAKSAGGKCEDGQVCDVGQSMWTKQTIKCVCGLKQNVWNTSSMKCPVQSYQVTRCSRKGCSLNCKLTPNAMVDFLDCWFLYVHICGFHSLTSIASDYHALIFCLLRASSPPPEINHKYIEITWKDSSWLQKGWMCPFLRFQGNILLVVCYDFVSDFISAMREEILGMCIFWNIFFRLCYSKVYAWGEDRSLARERMFQYFIQFTPQICQKIPG